MVACVMESKVVALAWLTCWACTADSRVYVENHFMSTWPTPGAAQITFQDPAGTLLEAQQLPEPMPLGTAYAPMPGGAASACSQTTAEARHSRSCVDGPLTV